MLQQRELDLIDRRPNFNETAFDLGLASGSQVMRNELQPQRDRLQRVVDFAREIFETLARHAITMMSISQSRAILLCTSDGSKGVH